MAGDKPRSLSPLCFVPLQHDLPNGFLFLLCGEVQALRSCHNSLFFSPLSPPPSQEPTVSGSKQRPWPQFLGLLATDLILSLGLVGRPHDS